MGDSGTFGSQKTMNAIGKMQAKKKIVKKTPGNTLAKNQLTGKIMLTKAMKPFGK